MSQQRLAEDDWGLKAHFQTQYNKECQKATVARRFECLRCQLKLYALTDNPHYAAVPFKCPLCSIQMPEIDG